MWYLIVTARSLLWMLASLLATLLMLAALTNPAWLVAAPGAAQFGNETVPYTPSVGVYAKCGRPTAPDRPSCTAIAARGLATDASVFPGVWKAATVLIAMGLAVMSLTVCAGLVSCRVQSVCKKSIFTLSGAAQAAAGICFIVGAMLQPMGWGAARVRRLCGRDASPFYPGDCFLGAGVWLAALGTGLTFAAACLSVPAENSTSSDKVQDQIYEGHTLICLV